MARILIAEDDMAVQNFVARALTHRGHEVGAVGDGVQALEALQDKSYDLLITDIVMPGLDGMEVMRRIHQIDMNILVIIITGFATVETAIEAMKQGAYDFIPKPFEPDPLRIVVNRAKESILLRQEKEKLERARSRTLADLGMEKSRIRTIIESLPNGLVEPTPKGRWS